MANIWQLKVILVILLILCTTSMVFYVGNLSQLENEADRSLEPLVYRHLFGNDSDQILLTRMVYLDRQEHLQKGCRAIRNNSSNMTLDREMYNHILVDERHKLLYCYVPKVACTNWKRVFMILNGMANSTDPLKIPASLAHHKDSIPRLSNYSSAEINIILKTYTKFLFVRNPFERLLSAYHNKLEQHYQSSKYFQSRIGRHIVKHYRQNASKESLSKGDDVTFKEFATYLIAEEQGNFNEHWRPIYNLCHPCSINYDIIGKYETFDQDSEFILKQIGVTNIAFPHAPKSSRTTSNLEKYFSTLEHKIVMQLYNVYAKDFKLFGYSLEDMLGYEAG
ncbi:hypothetical protein L9F63_011119 [Diploptera punctata]|uniref:Carbohydrate sulfotransferase n=1 Tax=Diploptera punctata TaxID=6984 RepID=A0AAD8EQD1_DIPPU|nr:hypothetical protein L9F63_011119 [Diploptera punctata]